MINLLFIIILVGFLFINIPFAKKGCPLNIFAMGFISYGIMYHIATFIKYLIK